MDNSTWTLDEQRLLNLDTTVEYELIPRGSDKFEEHLEFISIYSGRHAHNYKIEAIKGSIEYQNRFNIGALLITINGELSRSLMLEKINGWMLLSRLISHNHPRLPLLTVFGNNKIRDMATIHECDGIFATLNEKNKMYLNCIDPTKFRLFNQNNNLFNRHLDVIKDVRRLKDKKMFMGVEQYILYTELTGKIENLFKEIK